MAYHDTKTATIHVNVNVDTPAVKSIVRNLIFQYSEWLDAEGLIVGDDVSTDKRSHVELVKAFLGEDA